MSPEAERVVRAFIDAIDAHDVEAVAALMAKEHVFVGAYGDEVRGRSSMKSVWRGYFARFPDYRIEVTEILSCGDRMGGGFAGGSCRGEMRRRWMLPAAWRAVVEDYKIKVWQVYCDSKIPSNLMEADDRTQMAKLRPES